MLAISQEHVFMAQEAEDPDGAVGRLWTTWPLTVHILWACLPRDAFFTELKYEVLTIALHEEPPSTNPSSVEASLPSVLFQEGSKLLHAENKGDSVACILSCSFPEVCKMQASARPIQAQAPSGRNQPHPPCSPASISFALVFNLVVSSKPWGRITCSASSLALSPRSN